MRQTVHRSRDGREWDVEITPDDRVLTHETIPPATLNAQLAEIAALRRAWDGVSMIGNTQRHYQHVAEIPYGLYTLWRTTLGDPSDPTNVEAWERALKRVLNDPDHRDLRVAGGRL